MIHYNSKAAKIVEPSREIPVYAHVDVLVAGGGPAGIGAALSAARSGAKVLIIEQFNCLGGVGTAGGHFEMSLYNAWDSEERVLGGIPYEIGTALVKAGKGNIAREELFYDGEAMKFLLDNKMSEAGVEVLYHTFFCDVLLDDGKAAGVIIENKTGRQAIHAKRLIDCTGDGDVAAKAGVPFCQGRKQDGLCQPVTMMFTLEGVDWPKVCAWRTDYFMKDAWKKAQAEGIMEPIQSQIMGWIHTDSLPTQVGVNMTHITHIDSTKAEDLAKATIEGRRQAHHLAEVLRKVVPGMENSYLVSTAPTIGLRESRRIHGEITLTREDILNSRTWEDAVCYGSFFIDIHNPAGPGMSEQQLYPDKGFKYQIPYRMMVPQGIENLLVAGRCASMDHEALGSVRMMLTAMALGEAAGTASALSIAINATPREIPVELLQNQLRKQGVLLDEESVAEVNL